MAAASLPAAWQVTRRKAALKYFQHDVPILLVAKTTGHEWRPNWHGRGK